MKKIVVGTFLTLDGVMQAPGDSKEDTEAGFTRGGWQMPYFDADSGRIMDESMAATDALLLGRKTYEIFAAYWPHNADQPGAEPLNKATKHVASTTLKELEWENSQLIEGDVPDGIRTLKEQDGPELQIHGSSNLIQTLLANDLIDEFRVLIFPLVLGTGKRLFDGGTVPAGLEVTSSEVSSTGVVMATYRTGAEIKYGSFA